MCGALHKDISIGQLIIPDKAICDDGVTKFYGLSRVVKVQPEVRQVLVSAAKKLGIHAFGGLHWSMSMSDER